MLDSNHSHEYVLAELDAYSKFVKKRWILEMY